MNDEGCRKGWLQRLALHNDYTQDIIGHDKHVRAVPLLQHTLPPEIPYLLQEI